MSKEEDVLKHGECLATETLTDYLEGTLDPLVQAACEVHLAACDACRRKLAQLMRMLRTETTPQEEAELNAISESWDRRFPRAIPTRPTVPGNLTGWLIAFAGVAALVLFAVVPSWITPNSGGAGQTPDELLQTLLSHDRPFEAQLAGEPHLPRVRSRAANTGVDYGVLTEVMTQRSADQYAMGRFYLIQEDFDHAIPRLENAEKDPGAPAAVHNDLGVAYMERAGAENMAFAAREFNHALERNPSFLPAIFNFSIFYDRTGKTEEANAKRREYLQLDSKSGWADEIRLKLGTAH